MKYTSLICNVLIFRYFFFSSSLPYTYNSSAAYDDLKGLKYTGTIFDNGVLDGSSRCFCNGKCVPNGALNVTSCKKGLPFFISYPHFFYADSSYLNSVDGISPDKEKHESYVVLEEVILSM